jgi:hypothetical protein
VSARAPRPNLERRLSVSLTDDQYEALRTMAEENSVGLAWLVRYACEQLIKEHEGRQLPLPLRREMG